ncbi:16200_t:CDS:2 [Funneliformis caledonium]|uniref:16200_t:CDS:1 n=1 Tax=Funneliformis caledonium TaxID=1117310 RepID=A0A9N9BLR1_9GLOM|nr:16200_t:CDS:2 [Funneliformis caledonium]
MNFEEYSASASEEINDDIFVDQITFANAQTLLNDDDDNDNMNWNEIEPEDFNPYSNSFQINNDIDVEIEIESGDNKLQERLLSLITPTLAIFINKTMKENLSEIEAVKLLSKLFIRIALRIGKVESNKLKKERSHIVTLEEASMMEEKLER